MKYGVMYGSLHPDWEGDYDDAIEQVARLGFDVLEIHTKKLREMSDDELKALRKKASHAGIEFCYDICLDNTTDITSDDPAVRDAGVSMMEKTLHQIAKLGGGSCGGINFTAWNSFDGAPDKPKRFANSVEGMRRVAKTAEALGIPLSVEVTNRFEQYLLNTAAEAKEYCRQVDSPNVGIHLDINHMLIEEADLGDAVRTAGDQLFHFHVAESDRTIPGPNTFIPWADVAAAIHDVGYDRTITLEPIVIRGGQVAKDAKLWRDPMGAADMSPEAVGAAMKDGLDFIRSVFG